MTGDLTFTRIFRAPRAKVWECWISPEHLKRWFVPPPAELAEVVIDPRPSGRFFTVIRYHPEGTEYVVVARHADEASARRHEEMGFSQGWGTAADQLGRLAESL